MEIEWNSISNLLKILIEKSNPRCTSNQVSISGVSFTAKMIPRLQNNLLIQWENVSKQLDMTLVDQENSQLEELTLENGKMLSKII